MAKSNDLKINRLEVMMEQNNKDHKELKELINMMSYKIDKIADSKADKWVETAMRWGFMSGGVVFIGILIRWLVLLEIK